MDTGQLLIIKVEKLNLVDIVKQTMCYLLLWIIFIRFLGRKMFKEEACHWRIKGGGALRTHGQLLDPITRSLSVQLFFFNLCSFSGKSDQNNRLEDPLSDLAAPGNSWISNACATLSLPFAKLDRKIIRWRILT